MASTSLPARVAGRRPECAAAGYFCCHPFRRETESDSVARRVWKITMRTRTVSTYLGILTTGSLLVASAAWADVAGKVTRVGGSAEIQPAGTGSWRQLAVADQVSVGDHLRTASGGSLTVTYRDG